MSIFMLAFAGLAALVGIGVGYYLRVLVAKGIRGSMELDIKPMLTGATEQSQRNLDDAKKNAG